MTRAELIEHICQKQTHLSYKDVDNVVKKIFEVMADALCNHHRIEIRGFGSFELRYRDSAKARNPKNDQSVEIGPKYTLHFKSGKELRERVEHARKNNVRIIED